MPSCCAGLVDHAPDKSKCEPFFSSYKDCKKIEVSCQGPCADKENVDSLLGGTKAFCMHCRNHVLGLRIWYCGFVDPRCISGMQCHFPALLFLHGLTYYAIALGSMSIQVLQRQRQVIWSVARGTSHVSFKV